MENPKVVLFVHSSTTKKIVECIYFSRWMLNNSRLINAFFVNKMNDFVFLLWKTKVNLLVKQSSLV